MANNRDEKAIPSVLYLLNNNYTLVISLKPSHRQLNAQLENYMMMSRLKRSSGVLCSLSTYLAFSLSLSSTFAVALDMLVISDVDILVGMFQRIYNSHFPCVV